MSWLKQKWAKFKAWAYSILVSIGLISVAVVVQPQPIDLDYTRPTTYEDDSPLPIEEIAETRLYCNDVLVLTEPGADERFDRIDAVLAPGTYTCYGTVVATNGLESRPSNTVERTVISDAPPNPMSLTP